SHHYRLFFYLLPRQPRPTSFPYTTLFRSESLSFKGPSATIKTHHNVGGLPTKMKFKLVEPLRELFKDEVRGVGELLGLPPVVVRSEEHTSELQSRGHLVCRLLLEKKKKLT